MILDAKQREAVRAKESTIVQAGPGSGKTRTLVAKALREAANLRGTSFRVACVTMSRAATAVIEERISAFATEEDQARIFIGTIHAFCIQEIFQPFHRFIEAYQDSWRLLASDQEAYHDYANSVFGDQASKIKGQLPHVRRDRFGNPENLGPIDGSQMSEWWSTIERDHYVDFPSLLFRSHQILSERTDVAAFVSARYRWILVDEFQDTTDMQLSILKQVTSDDSLYFLVGDRNQGIYSFAGASPASQDEFVRSIQVENSLPLSLNYRSSKRICDVANVIIETEMESALNVEGAMPTVRHVASRDYAALARSLRDHVFTATDGSGTPRNRVAVIAPNSFIAGDVAAELRNLDVVCSRPEAALERDPLLRLLRSLSECAAGNRTFGSAVVFEVVRDMLSHGQPPGWETDEFLERVLSFMLLEHFEKISNGATWSDLLQSLADRFIERASELGLAGRGWSEPGMQARRIIDELDDPSRVFDVNAYRLYSEAVMVTWINQSKGLEFDAVAFVAVEAGAIPHYKATLDAIPEERRKFFVAITRAGGVLQLYSDRKNTSAFLDELVTAKVIEGVGKPTRAQ